MATRAKSFEFMLEEIFRRLSKVVITMGVFTTSWDQSSPYMPYVYLEIKQVPLVSKSKNCVNDANA